ncbi:hypothetical protein Tco_0266101 [Tanacetum coccineum]
MSLFKGEPGTQDRGCGYFMWMDDLKLYLSSSSGPSKPPSSYPGPSTCTSYSPGPSGSALESRNGRVLKVDKAEHLEEINQNVVIRSNGQKRYFSTLMRVLSIFDRDDLNAIYQLVMDKYQDEIPGGFDKVLWGDLMVMFNPDDEDKFWNSQQDWNIVSWKLHGSSGVHTLVTEAGLVIHMLVEKKYPLRKKVLVQMLKLKLESEEDSTMALELIRFVKKLLAELEPEDSDGDEEDL